MTENPDVQAILAQIPHGITVQDLTGKMIYANPLAVKIIGYKTEAELLAADPAERVKRFNVMDEDGQPLSHDKFPGRRAILSGHDEEGVLRYRGKNDPTDHWSLVKATLLKNPSGQTKAVVNTFYDLTDLKRSVATLSLLDRVSDILATSLDYQASLRRLADAVVPVVADWCAIDILDEKDELQRLAVAHTDPKKIAVARKLQRKYPPKKNEDFGIMKVLRTGKAEMYPVITEDQIRQGAQDKQHRDLLLALHLHSAVIVPLRSRGRTWGAITFAYSESSKNYTDLDLATMEELAHRSALLLDNSRLFQEAQRVISEQHLTQLAAEETSNTLQFALEMGKMDIWDWDISHDGQKWLTEFMKRVYISDRGKVARAFQKVLHNFTPFEAEFRITDKNENIRWVYQKGQVLLNSRGEPDRMLGVIMDITERAQSQEVARQKDVMFRSLFETSLAPIIIVDNMLKFVDVNKSATELFALTKPELVKKSLVDLASVDNQKPIRDIGRKFMREGAWRGEMEISKSAGDVRIIEYSATSEFIPNRNLMVLRDISDRREEELRREHLLTIASHELRTPLASIKAFVDILKREIKAEKPKKQIENYLIKIDAKTRALTELINDLLDLARIREKKLELFYELLDFNKLVEEILSDIQVTTSHKIVKRGSVKKNVVVDRSRISQVVTNLVRNAIKYSPEESKIIVQVSSSVTQVTLSVQDFGMGIPAKDTRKIFSLFYRAGLTSQKKVQGLGVGLHIASEIVKAHGGKIWVKSKINHGSIFYVSLPMRPKPPL